MDELPGERDKDFLFDDLDSSRIPDNIEDEWEKEHTDDLDVYLEKERGK